MYHAANGHLPNLYTVHDCWLVPIYPNAASRLSESQTRDLNFGRPIKIAISQFDLRNGYPLVFSGAIGIEYARVYQLCQYSMAEYNSPWHKRPT